MFLFLAIRFNVLMLLFYYRERVYELISLIAKTFIACAIQIYTLLLLYSKIDQTLLFSKFNMSSIRRI